MKINSVLTKEEIIKNVALKMNISETKVEDVFDKSIEYIHHLIKNTPTTTIDLHGLCMLYYNDRSRRRLIHAMDNEFLKNGRVSIKKMKTLQWMEGKKAEVDKYQNIIGETKFPMVHNRKPMLKLKCYSGKLPMNEIEEIQNNR